MKIKTFAIGFGVVALLAVLVSAPAQAQSQSGSNAEYDVIDDTPELRGRPWYRGSSGAGHGENNYQYTYVWGADNARGTRITNNNTAQWTFSNVPAGSCDVSVYVPSARATGVAAYHFYENQQGNYTKFAWLDQENHREWTPLTTLDVEGGEVRIYLANFTTNGRSVTVDSRGYVYNRLAADAMRISCGRGGSPSDERQAGDIPSLDDYRAAVWHGGNCDRPVSEHSAVAVARENYDTRESDGTVYYTFYVGECTSWVQFRLRANGIHFHNGYPNSNPPSAEVENGTETPYNWRDAENWDATAKTLRHRGISMNGTPQVGAVAQWEPNHGGAGGLGHVAYVERVLNAGATIVVSELNFKNWDSNGNRTAWCERSVRRIDESDKDRWPSNFIHF